MHNKLADDKISPYLCISLKMIRDISINEFIRLEGIVPLIDVRTPAEFEQGHVPGAFNVPFPNSGVKDIGILFCVLCIGFYVLLLIGAIRLLFSSARVVKLMGAGSFYFLLHTLKVVQLSLIYPYTIFIMFYMLVGFMALKGKVYKTT